ncbi:hypothetical protein BSK59_16120 [Paenibacillus odorifer]|uniref:hypothetical protein n=1 Tax=Paenibacillus odorifer TaxID=189426 RepID=UPI00096D67EE|nr:hypothetical protein [Paenibacillus odorifer]OME54105.1 hypothetical protein BSK59_16120 [Paenibacillus odorifer]
MEKKYLVKSHGYSYYARGMVCIEVVTQSKFDKLRRLVEAEFSYNEHEKAGKHSESRVSLEDGSDFVVVSEDINDIATFERLFGQYVGNEHFSNYVLEKAYDVGFFDEDEGDE